jgi:uncharacterized SAM-binding protein YcdF (DUF218 family)
MKFYRLYIRFLLIVAVFLSFIVSCAYSPLASKKLLQLSMDKKYDLIVVPGVPFENDKWSLTMKARVYWSKYLYDKGVTKNVMYSGSAVYTPFYEAKIMAMYAEALGIPKENIFTETKAQHSTENIYYSYKKAKGLGFNKIALATDPMQSKMLTKFIAKKVNKDVGVIPIVYDSLQIAEPEWADPAINQQQAFVHNFVSLPEREGFWKRLKGTWGKEIDTKAYNDSVAAINLTVPEQFPDNLRNQGQPLF